MRRDLKHLLAVILGAAAVIGVWGAAGVATQGTAPAQPVPAVKAPAKRTAPAAQIATVTPGRITAFPGPRTPWGDPDLQGNYTIISETNTPLERPDSLEGKRLEDFTPEEIARIGKQRNEQAIEGYVGQPARHWFDNMIPNANSRPWMVIDPPNGKIPPLTPAGRARVFRAAPDDPDKPSDMGQFFRCITTGPPIDQALTMMYSNSFDIMQTKDYVVIRHEIIHERRVIPIQGRGAGRGHNPSSLRAWYGDGIAHWEGQTLVVDTTNYHPDLTFRQSRGGALHTIERFTRTGLKRIEWEITVDDPTTWTRPWSYAVPMTEDDNQAIFEFACHETNLALRNSLAGARNKEKAAAGAK